MKKKIKNSKTRNLPAGVFAGLVLSLTVSILGAVILSLLIAGETVGENGVDGGAKVILFLSSALGAWTATALTKGNTLLVSAITAAAYLLALLAMTAMFFGGQYQGVLSSAVCILLGAGSVALGKSIRKKPGKARRKIPAYR